MRKALLTNFWNSRITNLGAGEQLQEIRPIT
jgi:hypothetical protein